MTAAVNIGLDDNARKAVADALSGVLADTYALYIKTHAYHWNVTGPDFPQLHAMFEEQYRDMWDALDEIAERIRALGAFTPPSGRLALMSAIPADEANPPKAPQMVQNLLDGHEALIRRAREALDTADDAEDDASEDLLTQRIRTHEKTAWMLRAITQ
ncbi:MAG: DNA starvation/stationary phase protection protein [Parvularculaceae bacterium]|nr:DNA starvation/stationary phase protection protein [Parvularculaceae bacterium]